MATDPPAPPRPTLKFCQTCNARERVIVRGRCIVCGNEPDKATDPPDEMVVWPHAFDVIGFGMIVILLWLVVLYLGWQVLR